MHTHTHTRAHTHTHTHTNADICPNSQNIHVLKWKNAEGKTERLRIVSEISYKWEDFGGVLGIPWPQLQCWNKDYKDSKKCCVAVLHHWLDNPTDDYPATWEGLCELIEDCDLSNVADKLREATQNFQKKPLPESGVLLLL